MNEKKMRLYFKSITKKYTGSETICFKSGRIIPGYIQLIKTDESGVDDVQIIPTNQFEQLILYDKRSKEDVIPQFKVHLTLQPMTRDALIRNEPDHVHLQCTSVILFPDSIVCVTQEQKGRIVRVYAMHSVIMLDYTAGANVKMNDNGGIEDEQYGGYSL